MFYSLPGNDIDYITKQSNNSSHVLKEIDVGYKVECRQLHYNFIFACLLSFHSISF